MTSSSSVASNNSSSSLSLVENGGVQRPGSGGTGNNKKRRNINRGVFDASETDPLLMTDENDDDDNDVSLSVLLPTNLVDNTASSSSVSPPPPPHPSSSATPSSPPFRNKKKRTVQYEGDNHFNVLFQMYGSVWPYVLPYCIVAVIITGLIALLQSKGIDLTFASNTGHTFMAIMVSFLVVTRANITYARFMEARAYLSQCYRDCRELVQHTCVLTIFQDTLPDIEWRREVSYRTIVLLRVTMAAIEFRSSSINTWDVMHKDQVADMELLTPKAPAHRRITSVMPASATPQAERMSQWAHGERTMADENFRAPIVLAYNLRQTILFPRSNDNGALKERPLHVNEELKLLSFVSDFVTAFHGLKKLITAPFPFPLVQMNRTFLFFWVFSLPLVLMHDIQKPIQVMVIMFFVTYGFIGLEYVSMELDDPFGDDPNDFDDLGMAEIVFEDIYITIFKRDGMESAEALRAKVVKKNCSERTNNRGGSNESLLEQFRSTYGESLQTIGEDDA